MNIVKKMKITSKEKAKWFGYKSELSYDNSSKKEKNNKIVEQIVNHVLQQVMDDLQELYYE